MTARSPLVLGADGLAQQLQSGDTLAGVASSDTIQSLTATGAITAWGSLVLCNSATAITATLPAATLADVGKSITVKGIGAGTVTVAPNATLPDVITGQVSLAQNAAVTYEVASAGVVQTVADVAATATVTAITRIQAKLPSDVTGLATGSDVVFSTTVTTVGMTQTGGVFSLIAGKTYRLKADVRVYLVSGANPEFAWVDATTNAELASLTGRAVTNVSGNNTNQNDKASAEIFYTPTVDQTVKVRTLVAGTSFAVEARSSFVTIEELPTATTVPAGSVTVTPLTLIEITQTADQTTGLAAGSPVLFTTPAIVGTLPFAAGVFNLAANKTYSLLGGITLISGTEVIFQWRDIGSGLLIGNAGSVVNGTATTRGAVASATVVTTAATTVRLEITLNSGLTAIASGTGRAAWAKITQLPTSTVVDPSLITPTVLNKFVARKDNGVNQSIPTGVNTDIIFGTLSASAGSGYNAATGVFTSPTTGWYSFDAAVRMEYTATANQEMFIILTVNGIEKGRGAFALSGTSGNATSYHYAQASVSVSLTAGDLVKVQCRQDTGAARTLNNADALNYFCGVEAASSSVVNAGTVPVTTLASFSSYGAASAVLGTYQSITPVTSTAWQTAQPIAQRVNLAAGTAIGAISMAGNVATIGATGQYAVNATATVVANGTSMFLQIVKNGITVLSAQQAGVTSGLQFVVPVTFQGALVAGDTIELRVGQNNTNALVLSAVAIEVQQQATSTVFQTTAGTLTATTLGYASASSPSYAPTTTGDIPFTVVDASGLAYTGTTFTLLANKRYFMDARLSFNSNTSSTCQVGYSVVRADNSLITGVSAGIWMNQVAQATGGGESPGSTGFFTPSVDTQVKVRVTSTNGPIAGATTTGVFLIQEQATTSLVNPSTVPVVALSKLRIRRSGGGHAAAVGLYSFAISNTSVKPFVGTVTSASGTLPDASRIQWVAGDVDLVDGASFTAGTNIITSNYTGRVRVKAKVDGSSNALNTGGNTWAIYLVKGGLAGTILDVSSAMDGSVTPTYAGDTAWIDHEFNIVSGETIDIRVNATASTFYVDNQSIQIEMVTTSTVIVAGSVPAATAATDAAAGTAGYPAISPAIGDNRKALFGDLTFKQVPQVYATANSYAIGDIALLGDQAITPVAAIPAGTAFAWGSTGATWRPVLSSQTTDSPLTWLGVYAAGTTYALGAVVAATAASTAALLVSQAAANLSNAVTTTYWQPMHNGAVQHAPSTPVVQRFTGTGTYTPTPGMKYCIVEAVGGGGAGYGAPANPGATSANYGASGAGGGYVKVLLTAAQISVGQVVTIGAGGVGGITGAGLTGSATTLGSLFSAVGGPGGPASVGYNSNFPGGLLSIARTSGVATPTITTGTNMGLITTHPGLPSQVAGNASFLGFCMGDGGDSPMGVGAKAPAASNVASASSAVVAGGSANANTGGGGTSGMTYGTAAAAQSGGNGGSGLMTITEFFV